MTAILHVVFNRPSQIIKCYGERISLGANYRGEGDAWGYAPEAPYQHDGWMPEGHFVLGPVQRFDPPIASEGYGQVPVLDMGDDVANALVDVGKATWSGNLLVVGGISARIGQLARYGRSAIFVHCGGSNAPDPYDDYQKLCRTFGCTRMFNLEWRKFADLLQGSAGHTIVYSAIGNPVRLAA